MSLSQGIRWSKTVQGALAATALLGVASAAGSASADIIKKEDMLHGISMTRAQCAAIQQAVWLTVYGQDFCVRYYLSTAGGEGSRPVVFLQGDYLGKLDLTHMSWPDPSDTKDIDTDDLMRTADTFSKMAKTTAIYIGRIGVEGTSGNHMSRKTLLELQLMNAALDAIKQRYGFEGFHLAGQSGGSKLVGGLVGLRHDVGCAVSGSGPLAVPGSTKVTDPGRAYFDVIGSVPRLAQNRAVRMMLITDPADQQVPPPQQTAFVDKMRQAGRQIPQFFVEATDEKHHGVVVYAELVVAGCVLGKSDADIARAVQTIIRRNAEINQRKQQEAKAKAAIGTMARQPAVDPRATPAGASGRPVDHHS